MDRHSVLHIKAGPDGDRDDRRGPGVGLATRTRPKTKKPSQYKVHQKGVGVCGIFTYEVAETKVNQVMDFAKKHQHPLQCTLEKA